MLQLQVQTMDAANNCISEATRDIKKDSIMQHVARHVPIISNKLVWSVAFDVID